jgi:transposase InsO family protein
MDPADRPQPDRQLRRFLRGKRYLIHDRDPLFRAVLRAAGIECFKLLPRGPDLNSVAERFVLSLKSSASTSSFLSVSATSGSRSDPEAPPGPGSERPGPRIPIEPARPRSVQASRSVRFQRIPPDRHLAQDGVLLTISPCT